jgi:hypothetical protein
METVANFFLRTELLDLQAQALVVGLQRAQDVLSPRLAIAARIGSLRRRVLKLTSTSCVSNVERLS